MTDREFLLKPDFGTRGCFNMKFKNPKGGMPTNFGIVFKDDQLTIHQIDHENSLTGKEYHFDSIDKMLESGWIVD